VQGGLNYTQLVKHPLSVGDWLPGSKRSLVPASNRCDLVSNPIRGPIRCGLPVVRIDFLEDGRQVSQPVFLLRNLGGLVEEDPACILNVGKHFVVMQIPPDNNYLLLIRLV